MQVILMRGLPGSGKSHWLKSYNQPFGQGDHRVFICSADDFHWKGGAWIFNPLNLPKAHEKCWLDFLEIAEQPQRQTNYDFLVVDNTNLSAWEIATYYQPALHFGLEVKIVRCHCSFETTLKRNTHNVPSDKLWGMYQTLLSERLPPWWKEEIIITEGQ